MSGGTPEWHRPVAVDTIGTRPASHAIEATAAERAALARRFGLISIDSLAGDIALSRNGEDILAKGRVTAAIVQPCAASGEPLEAQIDEPLALRFATDEPAASEDEDGIELDEGDLDTLPYDGRAVDIGEAAAQTLALAIDPFARRPDADATLREAGVQSEEEAGPFGALAGLRDKLADKGE